MVVVVVAAAVVVRARVSSGRVIWRSGELASRSVGARKIYEAGLRFWDSISEGDG